MTWHTLFSNMFVLSLAHKVKRRERLQTEFQRVGIDTSKVSWISSMNGSHPEIRKLVERLHILETDYLPFFTNGHLGCLFSHYSLWLNLYTKHLNEGLEDSWYLIMEDDTEFLPCVSAEFLERLWNEKPSDAKLIKFHATYGYEANPDLVSTDSNASFRKQTRLTFSLMCYAVHSSLLPSLLFTKWKNHIDLFHTDSIYIVKTPPGFQQEPQTLYSSEGIFTEGICKTNTTTDSDTVDTTVSNEVLHHPSVQQLYDSIPPKQGTYPVHIYDKLQETGVCHIHFQLELKNYLGEI